MMPHAVTAAAALTGLSGYGPDAIPLLAAKGSPSLVNTLAIGLLRAGLSMTEAARLLFALQGGLYCAAAALLIHALSGRLTTALAAAGAFLVLLPLAGGIDYSDYMILALGPPTHGILALGLTLAAVATMAMGWIAVTVVVLVMTSLAHPLMGLYASALFLAALWLADGRVTAGGWLRIVGFTFLGNGVALTVILALGGRDGSDGPDDLVARYYDLWDYHRNVPIDNMLGLMCLQCAAMGGLAWFQRNRQWRPSVAWMLVLAAASGLALYLGFHIGRDVLPSSLLLIMPNRFINIPLALSFPVLVGQTLRRGDGLGLGLAAGLVAAPLAAQFSGVALIQPVAACVAVAILFATEERQGPGRTDSWLDRVDRRLGRCRPLGSLVLMIAAMGALWAQPGKPLAAEQPAALGLARHVAELGGPILAADTETVKVLTDLVPQAPLTLNIAELDFLPYIPAMLPRVATILGELYAVDFTDPPATTLRRGALILEDAPLDLGTLTPTRAHWERLSRAQWAELARRHGFVAVAAPGRWRLDLTSPLNVRIGPEQSFRIWRL
ncbi:hypothetical protein [Paramagnetospirillum marisnigri]|nr:hypothetical protein [Paramagnetospirillum marisnigri]